MAFQSFVRSDVTSFSARLADTIAIQLLDVNFHDQMKADEALVQFFPNGTSDEFTIVLAGDDGGIRKITLDVITGLADTEVLR